MPYASGVGIDPGLFAVVTGNTNDALVAAKRLLELAEAAESKGQESAAAAAAVVAAVAHLTRTADSHLLGELGQQELEASWRARERDVAGLLRGSAWNRLQQLTTLRLGCDVELDQRCPWAALPEDVILRRNRLVHDQGVFKIGRLRDLAVELEGDRLAVEVPEQRSEWLTLAPEYAHEVVEAVETFLESMEIDRENDEPLDERLFSRRSEWRSSSRLGRGGYSLES